MHDTERYSRCKRAAGPLIAVGLLSAALLACGRQDMVEVSTSSPAPTLAPPGPPSSFQGAVAAVDPQAGEMVVDVQIVWAPVLEAERHERRVRVEADTRWGPVGGDIAQLHLGDEVQVEAVSGLDGSWQALEVQLLDVD